jgi:hypothetical protein
MEATTPNNTGKFPIIKITPKAGREPDAPPVQALIDKFMTELRPVLKEFLRKPRLPIWKPPENVDEDTRRFYDNLAIPAIHENRPSLLLHNLFNPSNPHAERLFGPRKNHR